MMKKALLFLILPAVAGAIGAAAFLGLASANAPPVAGSMEKFVVAEDPGPAPEISFLDRDETPLTLADFEGSVVLINFWATWCVPCVAEMPYLNTLQTNLADEDFKVLALSLDRGRTATVEPFYDRLDLDALGIYLDPLGEATRALGARAVPWSFLIDRDGNLVGHLGGDADWSTEDAVALMRHYLDRH